MPLRRRPPSSCAQRAEPGSIHSRAAHREIALQRELRRRRVAASRSRRSRMPCVPSQYMTAVHGKHRVLHGLGARRVGGHSDAVRRRSARRRRTTSCPDAARCRRSRERGSARANAARDTRSSGVRKSELLHQSRRVARPPLGHRPAAEHADAARAVDRGDLADARPRAMVRVPVLNVMTDRAVVHDVIQLDHAVVPRAQVLLGRAASSGSGGTT